MMTAPGAVTVINQDPPAGGVMINGLGNARSATSSSAATLNQDVVRVSLSRLASTSSTTVNGQGANSTLLFDTQSVNFNQTANSIQAAGGGLLRFNNVGTVERFFPPELVFINPDRNHGRRIFKLCR